MGLGEYSAVCVSGVCGLVSAKNHPLAGGLAKYEDSGESETDESMILFASRVTLAGGNFVDLRLVPTAFIPCIRKYRSAVINPKGHAICP